MGSKLTVSDGLAIHESNKQHDAEIEPKGREEKPQTPKKHRGRPKNLNFLPWEEARQFMHDEMIPSRNKFAEWWDRNKPKAIPRFPYRVYSEWVSWNDFLGTDNKWQANGGKKWRPFNDAVIWAQKLKLTSYGEWKEFCKSGDLPADIPAHPELVYAVWRSWTHWLGNNAVEIAAAQQQAARNQIYYVIHETDVPHNVITFGIEPMGLTAMKERLDREKFDVLSIFWYDQTRAPTIRNIIESLSTPYLDQNSQRIVPNIWEIIYQFQLLLIAVTPKDVQNHSNSSVDQCL